MGGDEAGEGEGWYEGEFEIGGEDRDILWGSSCAAKMERSREVGKVTVTEPQQAIGQSTEHS